MHVIHATVASTGFRLESWLWSSLGNSCCRFRVIHVAFRPDPVIKVLDLVLIQTYILDVLPEGVVATGSVESSKIGRSFGGLFSRLSCCVWDIRSVWVESIDASKDGAFLIFNSFPLLILNIFDCGSKSVLCFESCRRLHECGCICTLHFDSSCCCHASFDNSRLIVRAVNAWHNLVGAHVLLASLLLHRGCLAKSSDGSTHFRRSKPVSWVLLTNSRLDSRIVIALTWSHCCPGLLSKT